MFFKSASFTILKVRDPPLQVMVYLHLFELDVPVSMFPENAEPIHKKMQMMFIVD